MKSRCCYSLLFVLVVLMMLVKCDHSSSSSCLCSPHLQSTIEDCPCISPPQPPIIDTCPYYHVDLTGLALGQWISLSLPDRSSRGWHNPLSYALCTETEANLTIFYENNRPYPHYYWFTEQRVLWIGKVEAQPGGGSSAKELSVLLTLTPRLPKWCAPQHCMMVLIGFDRAAVK
jgi:hypothetical protein